MIKPTISNMADIVIQWYKESPLSDQFDFATCSENDLVLYHDKLGRDIRNYFKLWEYEWIPELKEGADFSEEHPDHISMEVIKEVWRRVK